MLDISQVDRSFKTVLIDADSLLYKVGFLVEKDGEYKPEHNDETAKMLIRSLVNGIVAETGADVKEMFLTRGKNFRYAIAKTHPYKGNRVSPKPISYEMLFKELVSMGAKVINILEADDMVRIRALELGLENVILAFIDKDLLQIGGQSFDYGKMTMREYITPLEADRYFWKQMLTGDTTDNIHGIKGVGKVKTDKLLADCQSEQEMIDIVWEQDQLHFKEDALSRMEENVGLLWLKRTLEDEKWLDVEKNLKL
jgi:5'-3' exonuclease